MAFMSAKSAAACSFDTVRRSWRVREDRASMSTDGGTGQYTSKASAEAND